MSKPNLQDMSARLDSSEIRDLLDQLEYPQEIRGEKMDEIIRHYRSHPEDPFLGVESPEGLVGLIGLSLHAPSSAVIGHIVVRRDHRGRGIGSGMIEAVCQRYSLSQVIAETDCDAVSFYRKCGFRFESLGEKYPGVERFRCTLERNT